MPGNQHLPPPTDRLWRLLRANPLLQGFVLIGGTALTLHLGHRISEDLDFLLADARALPTARLKLLVHELTQAGWRMQVNTPPGIIAEFEDSGHDWRQWQQDFIAHDPGGGSVKLTFVVGDAELLACLDRQEEKTPPQAPRLASVPELFRLKCIAAANRSKSRDWLDLYLLLKEHGFSSGDFVHSFARAGVASKLSIALMRMTSGKLGLSDEGFAALLKAPPSLDAMRGFFSAMRDEIEQAAAEQAIRSRAVPPERP